MSNLLLERSIIEKIAQKRLDESGVDETSAGASGHMRIPGVGHVPVIGAAGSSRPLRRKSLSALKKMRKQAKRREVRATNPKRSMAMRRSWSKNRKRHLRGWKSRRKVYGKTGRRADEAMESIYDLVADIIDAGQLEEQTLDEARESMMNYLYAVMADESTEPSEVYETILLNIAPLMTVVEAVAERDEPVLDEADIDNLNAFLDSLDEASEEADDGSDPDDANPDDNAGSEDDNQ